MGAGRRQKRGVGVCESRAAYLGRWEERSTQAGDGRPAGLGQAPVRLGVGTGRRRGGALFRVRGQRWSIAAGRTAARAFAVRRRLLLLLLQVRHGRGLLQLLLLDDDPVRARR